VIRPLGGALIAIQTLGDASPATETLIGLLGGTLAAGSHFTKAGTRAAANTSPEPFSNWILSFSEDIFVVSLGFVALKYPLAAAIFVLVAAGLMVICAGWIVRSIRRRWRRTAAA
jgi:O-antigen/teichoic acid export membrane protein